MSISGPDWMLLNEDKVPISGVAVSLLETISEIIASVAYAGAEDPNLVKIGCYLYRVSAVVMELQNSTTDAANILQSLSKTVDLAKELVSRSQKVAEVRDVVEPLEGVIKQIGEDLGSIPPSMYGNQEWVEIAVASLSKEMKSDQIEVTQISQIQLTEKNELEPQAERDLYSISPEDYMESVQPSGIAHLNQVEQSGSTNRKGKQSQRDERSRSSTNFPQVTQYREQPQYKTFFCPLTKNIKDDPVTIESGVACEGKVITERYEKFENLSDVVGPQIGQKQAERASSTNMAMKAAIEKRKERDVMARIKVDRAALLRASSESMVFEALKDLQIMCHKKHYKKILIQSADMLPLIGKFLGYKNSKVICATLELLLLLAEDDDEGKEMVIMSVDMPIIIRMLSSNHQPVKHTSLLLLLELSRSQSLCERIGSVTGGILILIAIKYKETSDPFASDKADKILRNLEGSPDNIKRMADNGLMEPLLDHLTKGSEETKMKMATYLGKFSLGDDSQIQVAERASPSLIKMVQDGNSLTRKAAFKALKRISTHRPNSKVLVEAGIVGVMTEELFPRKIYSERRNSKKEAAAILANVLESGLDIESIQINLHAQTIASDYIVRNIIYLLKKSSPDELNINLIRALLCLTKSEKISATIISVVKETEVSYNLMELLDNKNEELGVLAVKLLTKLSPHIGHTLIERLCETSDQLESLIKSPTETTRITEKQAVSANFLAKLPQKSLELNLALVNKNLVPGVLETLNQMQTSGVRTSRYANYYFEGLVGILVRFTTTLYDHQVLLLARNNNFTSFFTELLAKTSSDEVQRLSAIGLENLSKQSISLSKPPKVKKPNYIKLYFIPTCGSSFSSKHKKRSSLCPVHRGVCSSQDTFCLLHANATERLLACLDHENVEVVRAALAAICTLLDDNVDVEKSVNVLNELNTMQFVLNAVREHKHEDLWQKSLWVMERFLMQGGGRSVSDISQDGSLIAAFVSSFHHGDGSTRQMAENILGYLNKMPNSRTNYAR